MKATRTLSRKCRGQTGMSLTRRCVAVAQLHAVAAEEPGRAGVRHAGAPPEYWRAMCAQDLDFGLPNAEATGHVRSALVEVDPSATATDTIAPYTSCASLYYVSGK